MLVGRDERPAGLKTIGACHIVCKANLLKPMPTQRLKGGACMRRRPIHGRSMVNAAK